jgi:hypothetical protein
VTIHSIKEAHDKIVAQKLASVGEAIREAGVVSTIGETNARAVVQAVDLLTEHQGSPEQIRVVANYFRSVADDLDRIAAEREASV